MRRWVIADLHFNHKNVLDYCDRPYDNVEQMNEDLIKKWNNTVAHDDIVYVLGDFTLSRDLTLIKQWCEALHGRKILIMGNHDTRKPADYISCGFTVATRKPMLVEPRVTLMHEPPLAENIWSRMIYVFGHVHNKHCEADDYGNCICVSAERINYTPVDLDKLINEINIYRGPKFGD